MLLSIIIPCYNDGPFLIDAVNSVMSCSIQEKEIIIVNDGSTDLETLKILTEFSCKNLNIISQENHGLGFSRNRGIAAAKGKYILTLDADNIITEKYLLTAIDCLDKENYAIVYSKPFFFGEDIAERKFKTQAFDGVELLYNNYIDACAIFRKSVWEEVGGYDETMPYNGNEDWEFWINCFLKQKKFKFIDEELFGYRIKKESMISNVSYQKAVKNHEYILLKHRIPLLGYIRELQVYKKFHDNDQQNYLRTSIKYFVTFVKKLFRGSAFLV